VGFVDHRGEAGREDEVRQVHHLQLGRGVQLRGACQVDAQRGVGGGDREVGIAAAGRQVGVPRQDAGGVERQGVLGVAVPLPQVGERGLLRLDERRRVASLLQEAPRPPEADVGDHRPQVTLRQEAPRRQCLVRLLRPPEHGNGAGRIAPVQVGLAGRVAVGTQRVQVGGLVGIVRRQRLEQALGFAVMGGRLVEVAGVAGEVGPLAGRQRLVDPLLQTGSHHPTPAPQRTRTRTRPDRARGSGAVRPGAMARGIRWWCRGAGWPPRRRCRSG
jgi:hypothetical protein